MVFEKTTAGINYFQINEYCGFCGYFDYYRLDDTDKLKYKGKFCWRYSQKKF
ncbi:hypothetical protein BGP_5812 [Beggiatoa sp. PS]|nr:hypothetical protein BGP_5812 [Beggiatoa sp. PS]